MTTRPRRKAGPEPPPREPGVLWYLLPGGLPRRAGGQGAAAGKATHYCREGDPAWTRVERPSEDTETEAPP